MTWTVEFPDGRRIVGDSADDVVESWRRKSWQKWDAAEFHAVIAKRAFVWSGARLDPDVSAAELLADLDEAGVIRLSVTTTGRSK